MKKSVWDNSVTLPESRCINGDMKTDVLIIGAGLAGILSAYFLSKQGVDYILVEGSRIASGTTRNTTAKITAQHSLIYDKIINCYGTEKAKMYLDANLDALEEYKKLAKNIDCDFVTKNAYTYTLSDTKKIENEVRALEALGYNACFTYPTELPFSTKGAITFTNQAQFNPMKFISGIIGDLNIYENTFIYDITPHRAISKNGKITAKKIIITTHFPFINKHGSYFLKLYQHRSYVCAFADTKKLGGMYVDEDKRGLSFSYHDNLLLIGGGGHRTGKKGEAWKALNEKARLYYPTAKLRYEWAAQDCMSLDSIPYIGRYSKNTPDLFVASGFNKWGMTSSMAAAKILCDMVTGRKNEFAPVFSPQRSIIKPQLFVNGIESAANLLTPTARRCPHLGCALKWNKYEHSWDCPCHGSRFKKDGTLIDNPATGDADV